MLSAGRLLRKKALNPNTADSWLAMTVQQEKKYAFTLAEVLITLAIIGVIATMVVPSLLNNTDNKETVVGVKKAYATLNGAFKMMQANWVDLDTVSLGNNQSSNVMNAFLPYLAVTKNCGMVATGCFPDVMYKKLNDSNYSNMEQNTSLAKVILNDGSLVLFWDDTNTCTNNYGSFPLNQTCAAIGIDINGYKGPNKIGRDYFAFWITRSGIFPEGAYNDGTDCSTIGAGCTAKILQENAVNY